MRTSLFTTARSDFDRVILEGFHAVKHALRFGAEIESIVASETSDFKELAQSHASDVLDQLIAQTEVVSQSEYQALSAHPHRTGIIGIAKRPEYSFNDLEATTKPIILLDHPSHPDNVGASIRVAAAADAGGVILLGSNIDLFAPQVIRGSAGLHFALPVLKCETLPETKKPLIALDERGTELDNSFDPTNTILIFGSERHGISTELKNRVSRTIRIPMRKGVSSLNLATSVAVVLYAQ